LYISISPRWEQTNTQHKYTVCSTIKRLYKDRIPVVQRVVIQVRLKASYTFMHASETYRLIGNTFAPPCRLNTTLRATRLVLAVFEAEIIFQSKKELF